MSKLDYWNYEALKNKFLLQETVAIALEGLRHKDKDEYEKALMKIILLKEEDCEDASKLKTIVDKEYMTKDKTISADLTRNLKDCSKIDINRIKNISK